MNVQCSRFSLVWYFENVLWVVDVLKVCFFFFFLSSVAFLFNWIGFFLSFCLTTSAAGRYGAISGFGLSLIKWILIVRVRLPANISSSLSDNLKMSYKKKFHCFNSVLCLCSVFDVFPRLLWWPVLAVVGVPAARWVHWSPDLLLFNLVCKQESENKICTSQAICSVCLHSCFLYAALMGVFIAQCWSMLKSDWSKCWKFII